MIKDGSITNARYFLEVSIGQYCLISFNGFKTS